MNYYYYYYYYYYYLLLLLLLSLLFPTALNFSIESTRSIINNKSMKHILAFLLSIPNICSNFLSGVENKVHKVFDYFLIFSYYLS